MLKKLFRYFFPRNNRIFLADNPKLKKYNIGAWSHGHLTVHEWQVSGDLTIGKFCSFAAGVTVLLGGGHHQHWVSSYSFPKLWYEHAGHIQYGMTRGDVVIGNDIWIGQNSMILSGVTIGDGVVVGAGSVVRNDIPPYAVAVGNPARVIGYRFEKEAICELLKIRWWDWTDDKICKALPDILSDDIESFIKKYRVDN